MARLMLILFCLQAIASIAFAIQCNPRNYGHGSHVCVCSETLKCEDMDVQPSKQSGVLSSYATSKAGARFQHREYKFSKSSAPHNISIEVNRSKRYQKIIGFGGTFTDAMVIMTSKLPKSLQTRLIRDYFSSTGLDYNLCRVPIGGTDASTREYTLDDHPGDETLKSFALQPEDHLRLPLIHMAKEASTRQIKIFSSAWSSPAWMKTNKRLNHGGTLLGAPGEKYFKLFAKYLVRFLQEYAKQNATMWGLTALNEPEVCYHANWPWSCLAMNGTTQRDFIKLDLGPELKGSVDLKDVKLMSYDFSMPEIINFNTPILTDKEAAKYVDGVAFHWYDSTDANRVNLEVMAESFPDKFLLSTEACQGHPGKEKVLLGNWDIFNNYAYDIIKVLNFYSTGWVDWSMVQDLQGGPNWVHNFVDSPVIVNETAHEYYKQPFFYALGHFSKFLVPESVRVQHKDKVTSKLDHPENLQITVFERPDNGTVVTILNKNVHPVAVEVHDPVRGSLTVEVAAESLESLIYY